MVGCPQVDDLDGTCGCVIDQVVGLDVVVDKALVVELLQRVEQLPHDDLQRES